jgi:hypothetical protein
VAATVFPGAPRYSSQTICKEVETAKMSDPGKRAGFLVAVLLSVV